LIFNGSVLLVPQNGVTKLNSLIKAAPANLAKIRLLRRLGTSMIRMKISGHKTDSMERRYNIVDADDLSIAKEFMERRMQEAATVTNV
jgi:predicted lipid carrier protein YhbT